MNYTFSIIWFVQFVKLFYFSLNFDIEQYLSKFYRTNKCLSFCFRLWPLPVHQLNQIDHLSQFGRNTPIHSEQRLYRQSNINRGKHTVCHWRNKSSQISHFYICLIQNMTYIYCSLIGRSRKWEHASVYL